MYDIYHFYTIKFNEKYVEALTLRITLIPQY